MALPGSSDVEIKGKVSIRFLSELKVGKKSIKPIIWALANMDVSVV